MGNKGTRLVNTKAWGLPPTAKDSFRIGGQHWVCLYKVGRFALIRYVGEL
jgi:hypothetical protein